jgi:prolyl-tRNA synthetase
MADADQLPPILLLAQESAHLFQRTVVAQLAARGPALFRDHGAGVSVLHDDRDSSAGNKFADSDLIGIPHRIVVSEKTLANNEVELKNRATGAVSMVSIQNIVSLLKA